MLSLALDTEHRDYFHAVMRGCRRLSNSAPEIDGLDDLLDGPAQLLHDVELERQHRRTQQGYLTPADARAFLQMAKQLATSAARRLAYDQPACRRLLPVLRVSFIPRQRRETARVRP